MHQFHVHKYPVFLAEIRISDNGEKEFIKSKSPYCNKIWGSPYDKFSFDRRKEYFDKPNCNFNCPKGREFFVVEN
jgi:hypothetical protein